ncbi:MAG: TIM barrel protein [Actinobacteria bacterium]|nr:TIM barrel protein [Actinomycetota bacterium]
MTVLVASAPSSFGAFEVTVGVDPNVPDPLRLLDHVAYGGYAGIDLGPTGYLGLGVELAERLSSRNLSLAGGYLPLPLSDPDGLEKEIGTVDEMLDVFDAVPSGALKPKPTLADAGSPDRWAAPGQGASPLGADGWARLASGLTVAAERCRDRGYEPTFHPHTATFVETVDEIERVLEMTDLGLCFDTGHLLVGGGDPIAHYAAWADRINHIHFKDVDLSILRGIIADSAPVEEIWRRRAFPRLGEGDVPLEELIGLILHSDYGGWIVVEQDIFPDSGESLDRAMEDQLANRHYLRERDL